MGCCCKSKIEKRPAIIYECDCGEKDCDCPPTGFDKEPKEAPVCCGKPMKRVK